MALILGIETSCDETAAALYDDASGAVRHALAARPASHRPYGGVVPELASRDHAGLLMGLLDELGLERPPDAVACAAGPGLAGCLAAGLGLAQALAYAWRAPLAPVNHLEGHLLSPFLEPPAGFGWPYLALLASGGHSLLVHVRGRGAYEVLGASLDDAAGEAFDKTGQLLGLDFPGGAALERLAAEGDPAAAPLAPALRHRDDCMLSFAGLKTAARRLAAAGARPADVAASFQEAVVETLAAKASRALELAGCAWLAVVGGGRAQPAAAGALRRAGRGGRRRRLLSAAALVHRQRRDDRLRRPTPRPARPCGAHPAALEPGGAVVFTGIVGQLGTVAALDAAGAELAIEAPAGFWDQAEPGASVAVDGCCLTLAAKDGARGLFSRGPVTRARAAAPRAGAQVHLEHALRAGDPLGGHLVTGHVDGVATLAQARAEGGGIAAAFELPPELDPRLVAVRGSVAVAGVSLTVAACEGRRFEVQLVPATIERTLLRLDAALVPGAAFNFEADCLARYALRAAASAA